MLRIAGVELPRNKKVGTALTYVYGVGPSLSKQALSATNVDPDKVVQSLTEEESVRLREFIENTFTIEGDLRREIASNIQRLISTNCYRGIRHRKGLPVRGQRTKTNARTRKGRRVTVGIMRKKKIGSP